MSPLATLSKLFAFSFPPTGDGVATKASHSVTLDVKAFTSVFRSEPPFVGVIVVTGAVIKSKRLGSSSTFTGGRCCAFCPLSAEAEEVPPLFLCPMYLCDSLREALIAACSSASSSSRDLGFLLLY